MQIRAETTADYQTVDTIHTVAFGQPAEAQLVERIRQSAGYIPKLSLVAEVDATVVGHCLLSYVALVGREPQPVLALAPVAVHPKYQRHGIGTALIQTGLAAADTMREALVVVLGHPEFYPRFGFRPAVKYGVKASFEVPDEVFMVKPLTSYQPSYQGKVVYPATFDGV